MTFHDQLANQWKRDTMTFNFLQVLFMNLPGWRFLPSRGNRSVTRRRHLQDFFISGPSPCGMWELHRLLITYLVAGLIWGYALDGSVPHLGGEELVRRLFSFGYNVVSGWNRSLCCVHTDVVTCDPLPGRLPICRWIRESIDSRLKTWKLVPVTGWLRVTTDGWQPLFVVVR